MCPPAYVAYSPPHWSQAWEFRPWGRICSGFLQKQSSTISFTLTLVHRTHTYSCTHACVRTHTLCSSASADITSHNIITFPHNTPVHRTPLVIPDQARAGLCSWVPACARTHVHTQDTAAHQGGQSSGTEYLFLAICFSEDLRLTSQSDCLVYSEL